MPSLELIIGPMFSGKTTELIRRLTNFSNANLKVLYVNSSIDSRTDSCFSTHNISLATKQKIPMTKAETLASIEAFVGEFDVIGIDEAQFFDDLVPFCKTVVDVLKKSVIVCGLSGTSSRENFGHIVDLIPQCDDVFFLKSFCKQCAMEKRVVDAPFTRRIESGDMANILVGGSEKYVPACRDHF